MKTPTLAGAVCLAACVALAPGDMSAGGQEADQFLARARALHLSVPMFDGHNDYAWEAASGAARTRRISTSGTVGPTR